MDLHPSNWPAEFVCPISRSVMADPVIVTSGETYERRCIEAWLELGQDVCVKQKTPLYSGFMIPNIAVKNAIANLARSRNVEVFPVPPSRELARALAGRLISEIEASGRIDKSRITTETDAFPRNALSHSREEEIPETRSQMPRDASFLSPPGAKQGARLENARSVREQMEQVSGSGQQDRSGEQPEGTPLEHEGEFGRMQQNEQSPYLEEDEEKSVETNMARSMEALTIGKRNPQGSDANESATTDKKNAAADGRSAGDQTSHEILGRFNSYGHQQKGNLNFGHGRYYRTEGSVTAPILHHGESQTNSHLPPDLVMRPASFSEFDAPHMPSDDAFQSSSSPSSKPFNLLIQKLKNPSQQEASIVELRQNTRVSAESRISLCCPDILQAIMPLLRSPMPTVQINAVAALVNLSIEKQNKVSIVRAGAIPHLVYVLHNGFPEAQEHAAGAVFSLSIADENKNPIGVLNAIPPLVQLLTSGTPRASLDAAMALYHLSLFQTNKSKLVKLGAVPILFDLAESQDRLDLASRALLILFNVSAIPEGRGTILELNGIARLVNLLAIQSNELAVDIPEQAASVLLLLHSRGNMRFRHIALQAGAQERLTDLVNRGTSRAREKAFSLLAILKESSSAGSGDSDGHYNFRQNFGVSDGANSSAF